MEFLKRLKWTGLCAHEPGPQTHVVEHWRVDRGDIDRAYSADTLCTYDKAEPRVRQPFRHLGEWWTVTGMCHGSDGSAEADAYRLIDPERWPTESLLVAEDPMHYHGMRCKWRGREMVLCGPRAEFVGVKAEGISE